jgi:hypothetical protein
MSQAGGIVYYDGIDDLRGKPQVKATQFTTSTGRIVWTGADNGTNSLYDPCTKDFDGNPLGNNDDGSSKVSYRLGLAIAKRPGDANWWDSLEGKIIHAQGFADHPQAAGSPDFSWKVVDGDSKVKTAKAKIPPCEKEGFPGHWVFTVNSGFPFKFVNADGSAYLLDRGAVKCGDYVQIACSVLGNTGKSPGVYINHQCVSLQGLGAAIVGGIDPKSAGFGKGPQPVGMTPVGNVNTGSTPPPPQSAPTAATTGGAPPPPANAAPPPQQVPQVPVTPAPSFLGAPPAAPPPPVPSGPVMTAKAAGQTYAAFIAAGWSEALLRSNGYIV